MTATLSRLRADLDHALFPTAAPTKLGRTRWEAAAVIACLLILAVVLQLLRLGWSASLDSLWAEDGPIFLQGALTQGTVDAIATPYAGYLVLVPRLIGEGAGLVPLPDAAAANAILSALVVAASGLIVWVAAAGHIRNPYMRAALACTCVLAPVAGLESIDSAAYVPWYMLFAAFWLLLWRPPTMAAALLASLFILATGLSTPGLWFFLPVAAFRAISIRDRRDWPIIGSFAIGAAAQVPVLMSNGEEAVDPQWTSDIWTAYLQRVVDGAAFGERAGGFAWAHFGWVFLGLFLLCVAAALAVALRRSNSTGRIFAAVAIPISLALFAVSAYQRAVGTQIMWPDGNYHGAAGRYAIVPALLLLSVAMVLIENSEWRQRAKEWLAFGLVGLVVVATATSFWQRDEPIRGTPGWDDALHSAATTCATEGLTEVVVPISPPGFALAVPCEEIPYGAEAAANRR